MTVPPGYPKIVVDPQVRERLDEDLRTGHLHGKSLLACREKGSHRGLGNAGGAIERPVRHPLQSFFRPVATHRHPSLPLRSAGYGKPHRGATPGGGGPHDTEIRPGEGRVFPAGPRPLRVQDLRDLVLPCKLQLL